MTKKSIGAAATFLLPALLGLATGTAAQATGPRLGMGAAAGYEMYEFADPEQAGLQSLTLMAAPFSVQIRAGQRLRIVASSAWAEGLLVRADGTEQSLAGLTDTYVTTAYTMGRDRLVLSAVVGLPTGLSSLDDDQAMVAGAFASELFPFRIASWGAGGSVGVNASMAVPMGPRGGLGLGAGYSMGREFDLAEPGAADRMAYRPGDELRVRVALDRQVGRAGRLSLQGGVQLYQQDALNGRNLYQSGNRAQATASYAFAAGHRFSGLLYGGVLHREQGSMLDINTGLPLDGETRPSQDLLLSGLGLRVPIGRQLFMPSVDVRVFRREDGFGQGYLAGAGMSADLRTRRLTFSPTVRGRIGEIIVDEQNRSMFTGADFALGVRTGGHGQPRMRVERGRPVPERGSRVPATVETTIPAAAMDDIGETMVARAVVKDRACCVIPGAPVQWESLDPHIVSVTETGLLTGHGIGTARIIARSAAAEDTLVVPVRRVAREVRLSSRAETLYAGDTVRVAATAISRSDAVIDEAVFRWHSRDPRIAAVDSTGAIVGIRGGRTSIVATGPGASAEVAVSITGFSSLSVGAGLTCTVAVDGRAFCWGANEAGQLGSGDRAASAVPRRVAWPDRLQRVSSSATHACGLTLDGRAVCWGSNEFGQLGDGTNQDRTRPVQVVGGHTFTSISVGRAHSCAGTAEGDVFCWGNNDFGQLGHGSGPDWTTPMPVATAETRIASFSAGADHTCGVTPEGEAWCWGSNNGGQAGDAERQNVFTPHRIPGPYRYTRVTSGDRHSCGLTATGEAVCWGRNTSGQRGDGSTAEAALFSAVAGGVRFAALSAGGSHTCALDTDGSAWCWGSNADGQLGSAADRALSPARVAGGHRFVSVGAGAAHSCAFTVDGEGFCWGRNENGQLGDGSNRSSPRPVPVSGNLIFALDDAGADAGRGLRRFLAHAAPRR